MTTDKNELYPVFLKLTALNVLIVGGGNTALEKLHFLLKSSPNADVLLLAERFLGATETMAKEHGVAMVKDQYHENYLKDKHLVIVCTDVAEVNKQIYRDCRMRNILVNVADNPLYCDFYMGGIVTKGNLKIAISTNGKSPVIAKRLRQFFEDLLPERIDDLLGNLNEYRKTIQGDFQQKVERLNELTKGLIDRK